MKVASFLNFTAAVLSVGLLHAQSPADPLIEPVAAAPASQLPERNAADTSLVDGKSAALPQEEPSDLPPPTELPASQTPSAPAGAPSSPGAPGATSTAAPFGPLEHQKQEMQKSDE